MTHELALPSEYVIERPIGQGSFGRTYLAMDTRTESPCVVKQLSFSQAESWKAIELFEREAKVLSQLDHPRIPQFLGFYSQNTDADQQACLIQAYIPGRTLKELIGAGKRFNEAEVLGLAEDLLEVLIYLQDFSPPVIHRDIKPSNVIISDNGDAKLIDFGAVTENLLHREGGGSTIVGTFGYMPPEQLDGRAVPGTDLYALGATLIFAASGLDPQQIEKENLSLNFRPYVQLSEAFCLWLEQLTHPNHQQRFQSAREALAALKRRHLPSPKHINNKTPLWIWIFGAVTISIALTCLMVMLLYKPPSGSLARLSAEGEVITADQRPLPAIEPRFWFRDEMTGKRVRPSVKFDKGHFQVRGLMPGSYGVNVAYDLNPNNPLQYPGDLRAWATFEVNPGQPPVALDLELIELIHLKTPVDNNRPLSGWGDQCQAQAQPGDWPSSEPLGLSWDKVGENTVYHYEILKVSCGNPESSENVAGGLTHSTQTDRLKLPPSPKGSYYRFKLEARSKGQLIGRLRTHGVDDHDWDYTFRVR